MTGATPDDGRSQLSLMIGEWRRSWRPGLAALIGGSISYSLWSAVSSLFVEPMEAAFGWSRGEIALPHAFGFVTAFFAPAVGTMVDRLGARVVLATGLVLSASLYVLLALMTGSLIYYYVVYFLFSLAGYASTGITFTRIINGAFERTRGSALAIARSGLAISAALMPLALQPIINRFGFSGGFLTLACLMLFVALPLALLWAPGADRTLKTTQASASALAKLQLLVREPKILILMIAALLNYAPVVTLLSQLKPLAGDKGLEEGFAVGALSIMGFAAAGGALISGVLVDRFWAPGVAFALNLAPAVGCLFLLQNDVSPLVFYGAIILVGVGQGAEIDIVAFMIARYFGLRDYSTIYGLTVLGIALSAAGGATAIGYIHDAFGSYNPAIMACSASFALAACAYLAMGAYPKTKPGAADAPTA